MTIHNVTGFTNSVSIFKSTFSGRYLNFHSTHLESQKIETIIGIIDRMILLSHPSFCTKNLKYIVELLLLNNYPLDLIFRVLTKKIKFLTNNKLNANTIKNMALQTNDKPSNPYFVMPFIQSPSRTVSKLLKTDKILLAHRSLNKLNQFICVLKDPLSQEQRRSVVY